MTDQTPPMVEEVNEVERIRKYGEGVSPEHKSQDSLAQEFDILLRQLHAANQRYVETRKAALVVIGAMHDELRERDEHIAELADLNQQKGKIIQNLRAQLDQQTAENTTLRRYGGLDIADIQRKLAPEDFKVFLDTVGSLEVPLEWSLNGKRTDV